MEATSTVTWQGNAVQGATVADFSDAGALTGTSGVRFGDIRLCGTGGALNGLAIREILSVANTLLASVGFAVTIAELEPIVTSINGACL